MVRSTLKKVTASVSSTVVLLYGFYFNRTLSVSVTTTATISRLLSLFRTLVVTPVSSTVSIITLRGIVILVIVGTNAYISTITARFVLLVTTVYTTVVSYIHKVLPNVVDTLFVPTRKVVVRVAGFVSILVRPKKTNVVATKQDDIYG
jgi:hypothetical protein